MKRPAPSRSLLVLGYGNTLRGDDAAGPVAAEALAALNLPGVTVESFHQLTPELAARVAAFDRVVFIDAEPALDGEAHPQPELRELVPSSEAGSSPLSFLGHHQDPRVLLAMAGQLFGQTPRAWLVAIEARSFELGANPTLPCAQGIARAVKLVEDLARRDNRDHPVPPDGSNDATPRVHPVGSG